MSRQDKLEAMGDFEINQLVSCEIEPKGERVFVDYVLEEIRICYDRLLEDGSINTDFDIVDYCNNPADIMPIAIENKVGHEWDGTNSDGTIFWKAKGSTQGFPGPYIGFKSVSKGNPYRAICIVFILMSEAKE